MSDQTTSPYPKPAFRKLRGYSIDPSLSVRLDTALIDSVTYSVAWEKLDPGPVGEYVEIVDYDPASQMFYPPVNLDDPHILAQDGLTPSEGNAQFHQQMVYAVVMTTIQNFERALGRRILWAYRQEEIKKAGLPTQYIRENVPKLRIYPHALREANAYYSPEKKALLFGYFPATDTDVTAQMPGGIVFTCLSHDIVAHETTHAILDGMHRRYVEATHPDTLAFHEAFADIAALFQHFTFSHVLKHQIAQTRGNLQSQNLLGELAQEFGQAIGNHGALRSAIGQKNEKTGRWEPIKPDPNDYRTVTKPHARGAILVATIFDAFLLIYKSRVADLLRIATSGSGILPQGELHPDLVNRLADEAAKSARHILAMCIRALDYCPPVDITFGDYFRAIITADMDIVQDDSRDYRTAIIEAFRHRGIYPDNIRTLSVDSLTYPVLKVSCLLEERVKDLARHFRKELETKFDHLLNRQEVYDFLEGTETNGSEGSSGMKRDLHNKLAAAFDDERFTDELLIITGLSSKIRKDEDDKECQQLRFQVESIRRARRVQQDGKSTNHMILTVTQWRYLDPGPDSTDGRPKFRGGCNLIVDLDTQTLKYSIVKNIEDTERETFQRNYTASGGSNFDTAYYMQKTGDDSIGEPFALLHRI